VLPKQSPPRRVRHPRGAQPAPVSPETSVAAARDLAWTGQHSRAIGVAAAALAAVKDDDTLRLALLDVRAQSLVAQGEMTRARKDADAMIAIAANRPSAAHDAQARNCLSLVQRLSGEERAAVATATHAVTAARRSRRKALRMDGSSSTSNRVAGRDGGGCIAGGGSIGRLAMFVPDGRGDEAAAASTRWIGIRERDRMQPFQRQLGA